MMDVETQSRSTPGGRSGDPSRAALSTSSSRLTMSEAEALVRFRYGLTGRAEPLHGERDQNILITSEDGTRSVLKLCHPAEDPAVLDFQARALLHLAESDSTLPVPRLIRSLDGEISITVDGPEGPPRQGRLVSYLPGATMASTPGRVGQAASLGRLAAQLGRALSGYRHPAARHAILWDLRRAGEATEMASALEDPRLRARVGETLKRFVSDVGPVLARQRTQVIHNDLNPHNVVVEPTAPDRITGIIDFGDLVESALVNDAAIAAAYLGGDDRDPFGRMTAFVAAYHAVMPLTDDEIGLLPDLIATRHAMVLAIAAWRTALHPDDAAYIGRNAAAARAGLAALEGGGRVVARDAFLAAARRVSPP